ncbi:MAG TPA: sugar phosphate isomerase/epimerase family protein [Candidatus Limiplasma sp.]|nr:sugar phosphate isomerase/epimerase family protein [Candidatus Limiplasma sp.]
MKIGIQSSHVLDQFGYDVGMRMLSDAGFEAIDFNMDHELPGEKIKEGSRFGILYQTEAEVIDYFRPLKAAADTYHIEIAQIHAPFPSYVENKPAQATLMKALHMAIAASAFLGCKYVIIHPAYLPYENGLTLDEKWSLNRELYTALIPSLKKYGVVCCLENMFTQNNNRIVTSVCSDPYEACQYIDDLNVIAGEELFSFCLDTGHAILCTKDLRETILILGHRIKTLHVHDNDGLKDQHMGPFMGIADWDRFCDGLRQIQYSGVMSFETFRVLDRYPKPLWPECLKLLSATARHFANTTRL